jgi:hypothetical protein
MGVRLPPLAPDLLGLGATLGRATQLMSAPTDRWRKFPRGRDFGGCGSRETPWCWVISRCRHRLDIGGSTPDLGTSFTGHVVLNRLDRVGASHGTFREGRPARLTSHHPGCSVRVNGAGGGMKGTRLEWGSPTDSLASLVPVPTGLRSFAPYHDPSPPNRSSDPLDAMAWTRAVGRFGRGDS